MNAPHAGIAKTARILGEVGIERRRQDDKWGPPPMLPHGTGGSTRRYAADHAKRACDAAMKDGTCTYLDILRKEVCEAFAEADPAKLRAELVQVAAVAVKWIERIDAEGGSR